MRSLLAIAAILGAGSLEPSIEVTLEPTKLTVGDRAELRLEIRIDDGVPMGAIAWPEWESTLGPAEILDVSPVEARSLPGGGRAVSQTLTVSFFEVGEVVIPPLAVEIAVPDGSRNLLGESLRAEVVSVLPEQETAPEPKPPAPPQRLGLGEPFWWTSSALLATCLVAFALLLHRSREPEGLSGAMRPAPRAELAQALEALRGEEDPGAVHAGVSLSTRRFLGRLLGFSAPESTTSEVRRELRRLDVESDLARLTDRLLGACDMVMFAGRVARAEEATTRIDEAASLADRYESWLATRRAAEESARREEVAG